MLAVTADVSVLGVLVAFGGGVISFLSPCVLPIVPGYLSLVTGLSVGELQERHQSRADLARIALYTGLFVLGFTVVFVLLGLTATGIGQATFRNKDTITRLSGGLMLVMAAYLAGSQLLMAPNVYREVRLHPHVERFGAFAAPVAGAAFGFAWTPCIGPILGSIFGIAASRNTAGGTLLLVAYGAGLGVPFLVVGLALGRLTGALNWVKRHARAITFVSAGLLAIFGFLLLTDNLSEVTIRLSHFLDDIGLDGLVTIG